MNGTYLAQCHMFRVMAGAVTLEKILVGWEDNMHVLNFYVFLTGKKLSKKGIEYSYLRPSRSPVML